MIRPVPKALVLAVGIVIGFMLIAGCEEEENLSNAKPDTEPNTKRSRLIAVENTQLKEQIERQKGSQTREIERLKNLQAKETDRQKKLLDNCLREKEALEEMSKEGVENYMQDILGPLSEENVKLREEIETLKAQKK